MASVLCACFLLFAGCGEGGPLGGSGDNSVKATEGVKTLSKPATYEISEAIGENSVNFYNLFSREVMAGLYGVFADPINEYVTDNADKLFAGVAAESGTYTYNADMGNAADKQKFYLFDGMRYAIKSVDAETAGSARIVLDAANPWKWTVPYDAANSKIIFLENATSSDTSDLSQATFNFNALSANLGRTFMTLPPSQTLRNFIIPARKNLVTACRKNIGSRHTINPHTPKA